MNTHLLQINDGFLLFTIFDQIDAHAADFSRADGVKAGDSSQNEEEVDDAPLGQSYRGRQQHFRSKTVLLFVTDRSRLYLTVPDRTIFIVKFFFFSQIGFFSQPEKVLLRRVSCPPSNCPAHLYTGTP